jgi:hypothetical protein
MRSRRRSGGGSKGRSNFPHPPRIHLSSPRLSYWLLLSFEFSGHFFDGLKNRLQFPDEIVPALNASKLPHCFLNSRLPDFPVAFHFVGGDVSRPVFRCCVDVSVFFVNDFIPHEDNANGPNQIPRLIQSKRIGRFGIIPSKAGMKRAAFVGRFFQNRLRSEFPPFPFDSCQFFTDVLRIGSQSSTIPCVLFLGHKRTPFNKRNQGWNSVAKQSTAWLCAAGTARRIRTPLCRTWHGLAGMAGHNRAWHDTAHSARHGLAGTRSRARRGAAWQDSAGAAGSAEQGGTRQGSTYPDRARLA